MPKTRPAGKVKRDDKQWTPAQIKRWKAENRPPLPSRRLPPFVKAGKVKPQHTIVQVKVTTAGPVTMKAVREWLEADERLGSWHVNTHIAGVPLLEITVKRDAHIEEPRR